MFKYIPAITVLTILLAGVANAAETIKGHACYHYSDNESINAARDIALSMAKREALESYSVFVESSSVVENHVLKNDLIATLTAAVLKNLKVIGKSEDTKNRKVCRTIQAKIEPLDVKSQIETKIKVYKRKKSNFPSGLPENRNIKVLKVIDVKSELFLTAWCKRQAIQGKAMLTWYDKDGIPSQTQTVKRWCSDVGQVVIFVFRLPPIDLLAPANSTYDYKLLR
jgi:hypothetical protein